MDPESLIEAHGDDLLPPAGVFVRVGEGDRAREGQLQVVPQEEILGDVQAQVDLCADGHSGLEPELGLFCAYGEQPGFFPEGLAAGITAHDQSGERELEGQLPLPLFGCALDGGFGLRVQFLGFHEPIVAGSEPGINPFSR